MALYEYEDDKGHVVEQMFSMTDRPDEIKIWCGRCKKEKLFKRILSVCAFWGDFETASSEEYKKRKKRSKSGIETSPNGIKLSSS